MSSEGENWRDLSDEAHPKTIRNAADTDDLTRFKVEGYVYGRTLREAEESCSKWNLGGVLDACQVSEGDFS